MAGDVPLRDGMVSRVCGVGTEDVTDKMGFNIYDIDAEALPITRCLCGGRFQSWDFNISVYPDTPVACPKCGRKFYFIPSVRIYEVV